MAGKNKVFYARKLIAGGEEYRLKASEFLKINVNTLDGTVIDAKTRKEMYDVKLTKEEYEALAG